jgi:hypothetical protein
MTLGASRSNNGKAHGFCGEISIAQGSQGGELFWNLYQRFDDV